MSPRTHLTLLARRFWTEETGAILSAELALIMTLLVVGMSVGLSKLRIAINHELADLANAIGSVNQSYIYPGLDDCKGRSAGSMFKDWNDTCDATPINLSTPNEWESPNW